jgi:hypothetical protein
MTKTVTPTPEEHAYYLGWTAFFNEKYDDDIIDNPYDSETEKVLYDKWVGGWNSASAVATSMTDV